MNIRSALLSSMLIVVVSLIVSACNPSDSTSAPSETVITSFPHSLKGYELYSWSENDQWCFTLITGTNRLKSLEEITSSENRVTPDGWVKMSVRGVDSITDVLNGLPQHEYIHWAGQQWSRWIQDQADLIKLPPQEIIDVIREYCEQLGLELHISE